MILPDGYLDVAPGKLAMVVTCLEMRAPPVLRPDPPAIPWRLVRWDRPDLDAYRALYRQIGEDWLWFSRLSMQDGVLRALLDNPRIAVYAVEQDGRSDGLLELDFRVEGECELSFLGLGSSLQGQGAGRWVMNRAINLAWAQSITRFWVHTCTLDHPAALGFYRRSGFIPYRRQIEIADDPRLTGKLPRSAAPDIPVL